MRRESSPGVTSALIAPILTRRPQEGSEDKKRHQGADD
jgi:hypothetical protein